MQLPDDKVVSASVSFTDAKGNAAKVDGVPAWSVDPAGVVDLAVAADGLSAVVSPSGPLGSAQISVVADADLGSGVVPLTLLGTVEVVAGTAVSGAVNFGEPAAPTDTTPPADTVPTI